jgi:hypothetical protein
MNKIFHSGIKPTPFYSLTVLLILFFQNAEIMRCKTGEEITIDFNKAPINT